MDVYEFFNGPGPTVADFSGSGTQVEFGYWLFVNSTSAAGHSRSTMTRSAQH